MVYIEINGVVNIGIFKEKYKGGNISYIVDFKFLSSNMINLMDMNNLKIVEFSDVYKFVVGSSEDLNMVYDIIKKYDLIFKCLVYLSFVCGNIEMKDIVEFMKEKKLNKVRL